MSSLKRVHKYFSRKSSDWNIIDFLEECDLETYRKKIEEYLLSLETIVKMEKDQSGVVEISELSIIQVSEPSHKESVGTQGSQPDSKKAKTWERERSRKQVHIHQPTITMDISGNMGNITAGTISGGTLVCESKRSHEGDEQTKQALLNKRTKIDDYFPVTLSPCEPPHTPPCEPPHTPPHRIFPRGSSSGASVSSQIQGSIGQEFLDLDSTCSDFDHEEVPSQTIGQMQNYEVDIENTYLQLSQENSQIVPEEIRKIIEKIKGIKYRLFDYRIINLSERNVTNPVNKLSKSEKRILKDIWNSLEPSQKIKTIRLDKWEKVLIPLIQKYQTHLENKSVFDVISLDSTIEDVLEKPYVRPFIHKEHHDLLWVQDIYKRFLFLFDAPTNLLLDPDQSELSYRENFVNPIVVKVFDDIMDLIKVKTGEVENQSNKTQRIETRQYKQRVSIGCSQDGIYSINVNATILEVGFLEVVGNALYTDIKKLSEDTEKVFKCMQISIHYQRQHYISRGATEQKVSSIESYGIVVYQRKFTFYVMHRANGGLHIVDVLTEFSIPSTKDQLYVLKEVIENVYLFKSRIMDYYLSVQKIIPLTKTHVGVSESPVDASPSKASRTHDVLKISE
ncbi:23937_t:CDS:10 [Cetraspora pellucida]|uniref:23937_t:CDS:1 n=1 Tax=Cetraspora pellucida TaxID=1433469 RepID=A0A9N9E5V0_9GLOM|nr:23937_t:CDS:10 [Cetraspora pellucida]